MYVLPGFVDSHSHLVFAARDPAKNTEADDGPMTLGKVSMPGLAFRSIGPAVTGGRIIDIEVNPEDHAEYYVASGHGSLWKTTNNGVTFSPVFDGQSSFSIGAVALDPSNPNVVWVGTGENNSQRSVGFGDGVYKSLDGGKSWRNMGLKDSGHISMIRIHPDDSDTVWVAAQGPLWNSGGDRGLYKTTDGGKTWEAILTVDEHTGVNEFVVDPRNADNIVASTYQRRRHVWTLINGGPESAIHKSTDGGKTWKKLSSGIPGGDLGRIGLAGVIFPDKYDRVAAKRHIRFTKVNMRLPFLVPGDDPGRVPDNRCCVHRQLLLRTQRRRHKDLPSLVLNCFFRLAAVANRPAGDTITGQADVGKRKRLRSHLENAESQKQMLP